MDLVVGKRFYRGRKRREGRQMSVDRTYCIYVCGGLSKNILISKV